MEGYGNRAIMQTEGRHPSCAQYTMSSAKTERGTRVFRIDGKGCSLLGRPEHGCCKEVAARDATHQRDPMNGQTGQIMMKSIEMMPIMSDHD